MDKKKLTIKQERFCKLYIELGNASDAYRQSYATKANYQSVNVRACELLKSSNVTVRIKQLQDEASKKHGITIESLLNELEQARASALAFSTPQTSAAIAATMGKAKLCGLDKQGIDQSIPTYSTTPTLIERVIVGPRDIVEAIKAKPF